LTISLYGPEHAAVNAKSTFGVLVQSGNSLLTDPHLRLKAVRAGNQAVILESLGLPGETPNKLMQAVSLEWPNAGEWVMEVQESGAGQSADFSIPIEVSPQEGSLSRWGALLCVSGFGVVLWLVYTCRRRSATLKTLPKAPTNSDPLSLASELFPRKTS
jgi:hypothetical protein